jgi:hypothetical protein
MCQWGVLWYSITCQWVMCEWVVLKNTCQWVIGGANVKGKGEMR